MIVFTAFRILFLLQQVFLTKNLQADWSLVFWYGLRLDLSAAAYLSAFPSLLWLLGIWTRNSLITLSAFRINNILLIPSLLILFANLAVYAAWGTLINYRAVSFLSDPEGIIASVSDFQLTVTLIVITVTCMLLIKLQNKLIHIHIQAFDTPFKKWSISLLTIIALPLFMRGGLQVIPVNSSASWFSESMVLNDAATNPVWYLTDNINRHRGHTSGEFQYMPKHQADSILHTIIGPRTGADTTALKPGTNIVFIVLESWTADIIAQMGGEKDVTPFFNSLCESGLLFDSIYASGSRTDHMFPSVLSGLPSLPNKSMVRFNDKLSRLPMLPKKLRSKGYTSLFYYGGELGFANMNTFLRQAGFDRISGIKDYPAQLQTGKWGVADGPVLQRMLLELDQQKPPFFSMILTISTHEPFDVPGALSSTIGNEPDRFRNAARYTDRCLMEFFEKATNSSWFHKTLFVLVADHGHILPKRRTYYDPDTHRIPMLFTGPGLPSAWKGKTISRMGGQHDLPVTILQLLGLEADNFPFSGNLLDTTHHKPAYLNYEAGIGWKEKQTQYILLTDANRTLPEYSRFGQKADSSIVMNRGKAYVQCLNSLFESY